MEFGRGSARSHCVENCPDVRLGYDDGDDDNDVESKHGKVGM